MIDDLIEYYQRELAYLSNNAGAFADAHPKIASRLRLTKEAIEDPHVGRLIESVAFLNARLRHKIDDEYPELSDAILHTLYPHLIQPLPSVMVVQLQPADDLAAPVLVPKGTEILTEEIDGEPCRYRLCRDVRMMPLKIESATMTGPPFDVPAGSPGNAKGMLHIRLKTSKPEITIDQLDISTLRFYIKGNARRAHILLEQFGTSLTGITAASGIADVDAVPIGAEALKMGGLDEKALLLPQQSHSRLSYGLLQEHFAYPHKEMFFEVTGLEARTLTLAGDTLDLHFFFDRLSSELERVVRADDFDLFAAPAINLWEMQAEPILLDHSAIEYRIISNTRREDAIEVYAVQGVELQRANGDKVPVPSLYSIDRGSPREGRHFHTISRRSSFSKGGGDDVFITIADLEGELLGDDTTIVNTRVLAINRELPARLPFGGGRPHLSITGSVQGLGKVTALSKPTPTRRAHRRRAAHWRLVGQLSLNYLSLVGGDEGTSALREVLALYDLGDTTETSYLRDRLKAVRTEPGVARMRLKGHSVICAGLDVTLDIDDERMSGSGSYMLCAVIERFLAGACSLNSFVRLTARLQRESGVWKTWPARLGDRPLV
ncbi:MAG: type VI secretion system baseplate subunit TssF [Erythrobacter sp.]|nr:MAG: type VI secretion system baseplate subunit TssF [Erythrobacter sp.]